MKLDPYYQPQNVSSMILASRNIKYMRIFDGIPRGKGVSKDSGVVEDDIYG